ncbi:MAG TPA: chromosomal replication initiator protein DnaA [Haploplasma sp.]|nr:chromosomal replication initiator protein DnaA [Haploplasma sp.]
MNIYDELWQKILVELENSLEEENYQDIFEPIKNTHKYNNGNIFILVSNDFIKNRINKFYLLKINELAESLFKEKVRFKFVTQEELIPEETLVSAERNLEEKYRSGNLNATYSFDNFVVGKSNMFPFRMAMKVADQPGMVANPLYIFGDVGLGKTHLMQAIGNYILDSNVTARVLFVKANTFIEDYASLVQKGKMDDFYAKYREIDVLLVDDIQFLAGAKRSQGEFFKLFDLLYQNNKQIVITSDKPASELKDIMTRLTSRFEVGLTVDIQVPDQEHRVEILRRKLMNEASDTHDISNEILDFIASAFVNNIRELEGALKRVLFYCLANNLDLTLDAAKEALDPLLKTRKKSNSLNQNNYDKLLSVVADFYGITVDDLIGKSRKAKYVLPRHIAMYIIKDNYGIPYTAIGGLFGGRDHSTVLTACEKIENELKFDDSLKVAIQTISKKLNLNL